MYIVSTLFRSRLSTWIAYTKLMKSKKELRDLEKQKEKSSAKVGQFLLNLQTLKKQLAENEKSSAVSSKKWTPKRSKKFKIDKDSLITAPSSVDRLSPLTKEKGCFGHGDPSMVDEAGHPLVSIRQAACIVEDIRGSVKKTSVQRSILHEQFEKLRYQQKEIDEMELMKRQLQLGRAITNLVSYTGWPKSRIIPNPGLGLANDPCPQDWQPYY